MGAVANKRELVPRQKILEKFALFKRAWSNFSNFNVIHTLIRYIQKFLGQQTFLKIKKLII